MRYEKGDYFNLFMSSDLLITDCVSFLLEYIPCGSPLIRLERSKRDNMSNLGKEILKGIYRVYNFKELNKVFNQLIVEDKDPLKEIREDINVRIAGKGKNASLNIVKELESLFVK